MGKITLLSISLFSIFYSIYILYNYDYGLEENINIQKQYIDDFTPPFKAKNGQLYDVNDKLVQLRGINWFGLQTGIMVPGGLWRVNYKDTIEQMIELGFNAVRLPFCTDTLHRGELSKDFGYINPEMSGLRPIETMDFIIEELTNRDMFVVPDYHNSNCEEITDTPIVDGYSLDDWVEDLKFVAKRYKDNDYVIGIDLKNEPHGDAVWNDVDDITINWKKQAELAGREVLSINPNLLIFVEGIEKNHRWGSLEIDCESNIPQSWGGNIQPVSCYPIDNDSIPSENLVLSPHIYGPSVYMRDYFEVDNFPKNMIDIWEETFGYLSNQYTIIIGEMGGDYKGIDAIWQDALVDYLNNKGLNNFFYWSWNANSENTKGLVKEDDWTTVEQDKYENLKRLFKNK